MNKYIYFLILFLISPSLFSAEKLQCLKTGKIHFLYLGKEISLVDSYCFNSDHNILISENCNLKACIARSLAKADSAKSFDIFHGGIGSPGFNLCYQLKGEPQLIEFFDGSNWNKLDRCIFNKDESYIDTGSLINLWSEK